MSTPEVRHAPDRSRFEITIDGRMVGHADYRLDDAGRWVFRHTEVDPDHQGEGLAGTLVAGALDEVRAAGGTIVAECPYVRRFVREHPDYADLTR